MIAYLESVLNNALDAPGGVEYGAIIILIRKAEGTQPTTEAGR